MQRVMTTVLVIAAVAAGVYGVDTMRVSVARATLQNRVSLAAGETRDLINHRSRITMEMTCGDKAQTKNLQVDDQQLTKSYLVGQVPAECELTGLKLSSFRMIPPEPREMLLESPQFRNGTADIDVEQLATGIEITATGTATAGWFGREVQATAQVQVDNAQAQQELQAQLAAILNMPDTAVVEDDARGAAETEEDDSSAAAAKPKSGAAASTSAAEVSKPAASGRLSSTTSKKPEAEKPVATATPEPSTPEPPAEAEPTGPEPTTDTTAPEASAEAESEPPASAAPSESSQGESQGLTPEEMAQLWARNLESYLESLSQGESSAQP